MARFTGADLGQHCNGVFESGDGRFSGATRSSVELLKDFSERFMSTVGLPNFGWVVTGMLIVFTILLEPRGLYGLWIRALDRRLNVRKVLMPNSSLPGPGAELTSAAHKSLASGLSAGSIYALMALALVITYKTTEVPNFAQGDMAMVSAFIAYMFLTDFQTGFIVAFGAALVFAFLLGVGFEGLVLRRMRNPTHLNLIIMTLGFHFSPCSGWQGWKWGADQRRFPFPVSASEVVRLGGVSDQHAECGHDLDRRRC